MQAKTLFEKDSIENEIAELKERAVAFHMIIVVTHRAN